MFGGYQFSASEVVGGFGLDKSGLRQGLQHDTNRDLEM